MTRCGITETPGLFPPIATPCQGAPVAICRATPVLMCPSLDARLDLHCWHMTVLRQLAQQLRCMLGCGGWCRGNSPPHQRLVSELAEGAEGAFGVDRRRAARTVPPPTGSFA
eukprot:357327-Chlamydomonas_euryale.AAC.5